MGQHMTRQRLPYVHAYVDRLGKARFYFRKRGHKKIALPSSWGSPEFMAAYQAALDRSSSGEPVAVKSTAAAKGSVSDLVDRYFASKGFLGLRASTRATYRGIIERFRAEHGDKRVSAINQPAVERLVAKKTDTPAAANNFLRMLRTLMEFAVKQKMRHDDPTEGVDPVKNDTDGFHTWTEAEIAQFEAHWPIGSRARLAFALHLFIGQRRSDVVKMTWRDIAGGFIHVRQTKTGRHLEIPLHADLVEVLAGSKREHITILIAAGKPFAVAGYGNWFRDVTTQAGLPKRCSSHGLRKAAARRLAECGCSSPEIGAVTGHKNLREIERYIAAANQKKLAGSAMARLANAAKSPDNS